MKCLLLFLIVGGALLAGAQQNPPVTLSYTDVQGIILPANVNRHTEGSPFLMADYCNANIKVQNGKRYEMVPVKINLQENTIYFKFGDQAEMIATVPIEYIEFTECSADGRTKMVRLGFPPVDNNTPATYYEVLSDGPVQLLKHSLVTYHDYTAFNSIIVSRAYQRTTTYYAYSVKAGITKLKDQDAALVALADHKELAQKFISEQNIKLKKESDLMKLITYYNSL